jgi:hypothetical protein
MAQADTQVIQFPTKRRRRKAKSQYELYPLPFFNADAHCTWDVKPTGDYTVDCETGRRYATEFLQSCDGTLGWTWLLQSIVADMIRAGTDGTFPSGHPTVNGIVIGFMGVIGRAACVAALAFPAETFRKA